MALTYQGSASSVTNTVTLPTHAVGDLIVIYNLGETTAPSAGGTVPTWTAIGTDATPQGMWYAVATATNHTSGTWAAAMSLIAVVLRGQAANPVGGYAFGTSGGTSSVTAPSITLGDSSGASQILHFLTAYGGFTARTWSSAPSGYTARTSITVPGYGFGCRLLTKDTTTSDGTATNSLSGSVTNTYAASLEIKGTKTSAFFAMF